MEIPRDRDVIVYCHHGARSLQAARFLRQRGIDARSLKGGLDRWSLTVDPNTPRY
jgi:rhodanese-related sulfurtransferase